MSELLRAYLATNRHELNRKVELTRKARPSLENHSLATLLKDALSPLVQALSQVRPGLAESMACEGFDLALQIAAMGPDRSGSLADIVMLWNSLVPHAACLGPSPAGSLSKLTNALLFLRTSKAVHIPTWLGRIREMEPDEAHLQERLLFLAWISGYAPLREHVLDLAPTLPQAFLAKALEHQDPQLAIQALRSDSWWEGHKQPARVIGRCGGYEAYGNLFQAPPIAFVHQSHVLISSGTQTFRLHADRYGVQLIAIQGQVTPPAHVRGTDSPGLSWNGNFLETPTGKVPIPFPHQGRQAVAGDGMIVVTSESSFSLFVIAP